MIKVLVAFLMLSGAAQAGAWAEFEARCLGPMEALEAPSSEGMDLVSMSDDLAMFLGQGLSLTVFFEDGASTGCWGAGIEQTFNANGTLTNTRKEIIDDGVAHFDAKVAEGRYTVVDVSDVPYLDAVFERRVLHSHLWREPVLEVVLEVWPTHGSISVKETDLES